MSSEKDYIKAALIAGYRIDGYSDDEIIDALAELYLEDVKDAVR